MPRGDRCMRHFVAASPNDARGCAEPQREIGLQGAGQVPQAAGDSAPVHRCGQGCNRVVVTFAVADF